MNGVITFFGSKHENWESVSDSTVIDAVQSFL